MKTRTIVLIIVGALLAAAIAYLIALAAYVGFWTYFSLALYKTANSAPPPDPPAIASAEFPFTLVYERDGEEIVLNDTMTCEHTGSEIYGDSGPKYRKWELTYSDGTSDIVLYHKETGSNNTSILFQTGYLPYYLMGDTEHFNYRENYLDTFSELSAVKKTSSLGMTGWSAITEEELYEEFGIKLISFEVHAEPVENSFIPAE